MHDKRELLFEKMRGTELENLEKKKRNKPNENLATIKVNAHSQWLDKLKSGRSFRTFF
jgi:hypothetical protein